MNKLKIYMIATLILSFTAKAQSTFLKKLCSPIVRILAKKNPDSLHTLITDMKTNSESVNKAKKEIDEYMYSLGEIIPDKGFKERKEQEKIRRILEEHAPKISWNHLYWKNSSIDANPAFKPFRLLMDKLGYSPFELAFIASNDADTQRCILDIQKILNHYHSFDA